MSGKRQNRTCRWSVDDDGNWDTDCAQKHILMDGTPFQNHYSYCCYCGKAIKQVVRKESA